MRFVGLERKRLSLHRLLVTFLPVSVEETLSQVTLEVYIQLSVGDFISNPLHLK